MRPLERAAKGAILAAARPLLLGSRPSRGEPVLRGRIRIAAIRQDDRLGNLVLITPFLQRLRESFPEAAIDAIVSDRYQRILDGFPGLDGVLPVEKDAAKRGPWRYVRFLKGLGRRGYDLAFDLSDANAFSLSSALMTLATCAPVRVGFENARTAGYLTLAVPPPPAGMHASEAALVLLREVAGPVPAAPLHLPLPGSSAAVDAFLEKARPNGERLVGVNLGGRGRKRWPTASYRRLLEAILESGLARPVLIWGPSEREIADTLRDLSPRGAIEAPLFREDDLGRLLRALDLFITPDTGAMHLAAAVGAPVIALFVDSDKEKYAPRGPLHRVLGGRGEEIDAAEVMRAAEERLGHAGETRRTARNV